MAEEILYVESRRAARVKRMQTVQHVFAAILLGAAGFSHFQHNRGLSILEIVAAALLIATVIEERIRHHAPHKRIASVEFAGALMGFVEAAEKTRGPHHVSFVILSFLAPVILLVFAMSDARLGENRYIRVDDRGIELQLRRLFRQHFRWKEIRGYRLGEDAIDFGGRTLKLRDIVDRDRAKAWVVDALERRGVGELPAQQLPGSKRGA